MQESIDEGTVTLTIRSAKLTASVVRDAIEKYLAYRANEKAGKARDGTVTILGKQNVRKLMSRGEKLGTEQLEEGKIRDFERIARKYHVAYAVRKVRSADPPAWQIFFRAKDRAVLDAALESYRSWMARDPEKAERILRRLRARSFRVQTRTREHAVPER